MTQTRADDLLIPFLSPEPITDDDAGLADAAILEHVHVLTVRVMRLVAEHNHELVRDTIGLATEVGTLRERTGHQEERLVELRQERDHIQAESAWLHETILSLEDELKTLQTSYSKQQSWLTNGLSFAAITVLVVCVAAGLWLSRTWAWI